MVAKRPNINRTTAAAPIKTISGLNGAIPTTWDAGWQLYTDLSPEQIAAYCAMPEWQTFVASFNSWESSLSSTGLQVNVPISAPSLTVATVQQLQPVSIGPQIAPKA